jgi:hypothetical protein
VHDGMKLDPIRHRFTLGQLNGVYYPFRYRDLERLAKFQNVVLAKYARTHHLPFIDVAGAMPEDPDPEAKGPHPAFRTPPRLITFKCGR